jgi:hypothetical protein
MNIIVFYVANVVSLGISVACIVSILRSRKLINELEKKLKQ